MNDIVYESPQINELATALAKAQGEFPEISKDKSIVYKTVKRSYTSLENIIKTIKGILSKYGLSVTQRQRIEDNNIYLVTRLSHNSGQWMDSWAYLAPIGLNSTEQQNFGTAKTYQRRYELLAVLNLSPSDETDNDGNPIDVQPEDGAEKDVETINKDQSFELYNLFKDHPEIKAKFFDFYKISHSEQLPLEHFVNAKKALEASIAKKIVIGK